MATSGMLVQPAPPDIDETTAARIAREGWGVIGRARALGSHQDRNFLILRSDAARAAAQDREPERQRARARGPVRGRRGDRRARRRPRTSRALRFAGAPSGRSSSTASRCMPVCSNSWTARPSPATCLPSVVRAIGTLAATVDVALADLDSPAAERRHQWDLREAPACWPNSSRTSAMPHCGEIWLSAAASAWQVVERGRGSAADAVHPRRPHRRQCRDRRPGHTHPRRRHRPRRPQPHVGDRRARDHGLFSAAPRRLDLPAAHAGGRRVRCDPAAVGGGGRRSLAPRRRARCGAGRQCAPRARDRCLERLCGRESRARACDLRRGDGGAARGGDRARSRDHRARRVPVRAASPDGAPPRSRRRRRAGGRPVGDEPGPARRSLA